MKAISAVLVALLVAACGPSAEDPEPVECRADEIAVDLGRPPQSAYEREALDGMKCQPNPGETLWCCP
jgi:hypothetical protein